MPHCECLPPMVVQAEEMDEPHNADLIDFATNKREDTMAGTGTYQELNELHKSMLEILIHKIHAVNQVEMPTTHLVSRVSGCHDMLDSMQEGGAIVWVDEARCYMNARELKVYYEQAISKLKELDSGRV